MIGKITAAVVVLAAFSATAEEVSLQKDLMPLFERSCAGCHNPESRVRGAIKDKAYFASKEDILGRIGSAIVAGKPEESGLIKVLDHTAKFGKKEKVMPPKESEVQAWTEDEIRKITAWIKAGAKDN
jgi:mono/diheme cytochrome c family protein